VRNLRKSGGCSLVFEKGSRGHKKKMARFLTGLFTISSGLEAWVTDYWGVVEGVRQSKITYQSYEALKLPELDALIRYTIA
jgi:hypothetical protein